MSVIRPRSTLSKRAGLILPVGYFHPRIKANCPLKVSNLASVNIVAAVQYLLEEIIILTSRRATEDKRSVLAPKHMIKSLSTDPDIKYLFANVTVPGGGVIGFIHPELKSKSKRKRKLKLRQMGDGLSAVITLSNTQGYGSERKETTQTPPPINCPAPSPQSPPLLPSPKTPVTSQLWVSTGSRSRSHSPTSHTVKPPKKRARSPSPISVAFTTAPPNIPGSPDVVKVRVAGDSDAIDRVKAMSVPGREQSSQLTAKPFTSLIERKSKSKLSKLSNLSKLSSLPSLPSLPSLV